MKTRKNYFVKVGAIALVWLSFSAVGQSLTPIIPVEQLYIDVNAMNEQRTFEVTDNRLNFQYQDMKGQGELNLKVYTWKLELAAEFSLDKSLGLNQYTIELRKSGIELNSGDVFHCVLNDNSGNEFKWLIREKFKPEPKKIIPQITVKPIEVNCSKAATTESVIEFYGDAEGGNKPYTMSWYVLNEARTALLYQPKADNLDAVKGALSMITVDKSPAYYVMLQVVDPCGNTGEKMVYVNCKDYRKKINTIFVEPLPMLPKEAPKGNEFLPLTTP